MTLDAYSWSVLSSASSARGYGQCYALSPGCEPVRTGRFRIAWLDDEGDLLAWWTGNTADLTGGWEAERSLLCTDVLEAAHQMDRAVRSFGDRRDRRVEMMEML